MDRSAGLIYMSIDDEQFYQPIYSLQLFDVSIVVQWDIKLKLACNEKLHCRWS